MAFAEADLSRALDDDEFFPVFQPLVELRTGQLAGFEVLARWQPPDSALIMPADFIPAIEKAGLADHLCNVVLGKALAATPIVDSSLMLSFNLSPTQLLDPSLPGRLESQASAAGLALDRLTVEITESALLDDLPRAMAVARALKDLRCRLALDDFGTGYSSLKHLHALPFDVLKVDRSFVSSMSQQRESRKIVASVIGLGQSLGLLTVAEGIETFHQAELLFWLGCDLGQGWLYSRPVPAAELAHVIADSSWPSATQMHSPEDGIPLLVHDPMPAHRVAQLQAVYDGAPVGLCFLDRELRYVNLNRQLAQMNGLSVAAHIGRTVAEVIPHVAPIAEPYLRRALEGEVITGIEMCRPPISPGGRPVSIVASYLPVRDEAGDILGVSVAIMDVTQSKYTEERLRESEEHFRHWMRLSPHVPWVLDSEGGVSEASPNWTQYTGQPMTEAMGNGWTKMLHPDDISHTVEAIRLAIEEGRPIDIEYRVRRPGEDWKWMRSRGAPRFDSTGRAISVYGVVEQIDGQKQIVRELEICEAELRSAIDAVRVGIIIANANDGTIFMVNPRARKTFGNGAFPGQKLDEYTLMGLLNAGGQPIRAEDYPLARSIQRGETIETHPYISRCDNGAVCHISISSRPVRSDEGSLIGGIMLIHDPEAGTS